MAKTEEKLNGFAESLIKGAGLPFEETAGGAREIVVFGSRAAGVHSPNSHLDLLYVSSTPGRRLKRAGLDLLWLTPKLVEGPEWRGSELAGHIAAHGRWLQGVSNWKAEVFSSPAAVEKKRRQLQDRIRGLDANWNSLAMPYRRRLFTLVRRDLQRLELLEEGRPIPPTPLLDGVWQNIDDPLGWILRWLPEVSGLSDREKTRFAHYSSELFHEFNFPVGKCNSAATPKHVLD